jgi:hypothetical protein
MNSAVKNYKITLLLLSIPNFFLYRCHFFVSHPPPIYKFTGALSVFIAINTKRAQLNLYVGGGFETKKKHRHSTALYL